MRLFGGRPSFRAVALIDIAPDSVAGGFAVLEQGKEPLMLFAKRAPIAFEGGEAAASLAHALSELGNELITKGAPLLLRKTGSGSVEGALVSINVPWQVTTVRSEKIEKEKPFTFTHALMKDALKISAQVPKNFTLVDESVIGTTLDGYAVKEPVGKRITYANIIVLTSAVEKNVATLVSEGVRRLFHRRHVRIVAAPALHYQALRLLFPHEEEYLVVECNPNSITTLLVRRGMFTTLEVSEVAGEKSAALPSALLKNLSEITKRFPLPRMIFLLAPDELRDELKAELESEALANLRLSKQKPAVVPLTPSALSLVHLAPEAAPDCALMLAALLAFL